MTEIQWSTVDRYGERAMWPGHQEAADYIVRRLRWGLALPGEEKVFMRAVTEWKEMGSDGTRRNEGGDPGGTPDTPAE